ncbi:MAG: MBL fold metallo-hydrolase [Anaerolineae bacterium]|jgi:phosphoribosyl 1,2-cyclic phosphate phosphodiesterase
MQLIFLGCGDEHGVPRIGCDCEVCRSALSPDSYNARTGPSVALRYGPSYAERVVLIDVALEFRLQATYLGLRQIDALLLTHIHDAHVLGLSMLLAAQREAGHPLRLYAPAQVMEDAEVRFAHLWNDKTYRRILQPRVIQDPLDLWGLRVQPLRIDHGLGGTAYAYLLELGARRLAYVSDMLRPTAETRQALKELDLLVLGASHYYEGIEMWKRTLMDIMAAQELVRELSPGQAILTHMSHTVDYEEVSAKVSPPISLAYDGLVVEVHE